MIVTSILSMRCFGEKKNNKKARKILEEQITRRMRPTHKEYEQGESEQEVTWKRSKQNINDKDELIGKGKKVLSPQLIVLHGIGSDGVKATKVK
ncbi:hypothetical protein HPP92_006547 [Vanilla planifolia]|uniref:Uncharacterized protein n=1 Tax=Vanilla planifolia TaxID=51239 RepID=A0A835VA43_VANPL|nr:hypothetical protein HPP92_006547 [Vanilla planifolia]